jgi:hypothetical protein
MARCRWSITRVGVSRGSLAMSYYAEYNTLQTLVKKEGKEGLTKAEEALESKLLEELGFNKDSVDIISFL